MTSAILATERARQTPIGEIPESWSVTPIGDLFDVQQGKALSPTARAGPAMRPFLRTANVFWGRVDLRTVDRMHFSGDEADRLSLKRGDLLVCEGGDIGRAAIWSSNEPGYGFQNHLHRLRPKNAMVDPEYVMYWLQAAFVHLGTYIGVGNRTTIPNLSASRLKALEIPQPPIIEQHAIAGVLSKLQGRVEVQDRIVASLRELKAATMAKLFREGLRGEPLKQTEIGEMPESWDVTRLGSPGFARTASGGTPSRQVAAYYGGGIPWLKSGELLDGTLKSSAETLSPEGLRSSSAHLLPAGTLVVAMYGATTGMTGILGIPASTNQAVCAIAPVDNSFDSEFLRHYLIFARERLLQARHGGAQPNISQQILREFLVPVPSRPDQTDIGGTLRSLSLRLESAEHFLTSLSLLLAECLQMLINGRKRLPLAPSQAKNRRGDFDG